LVLRIFYFILTPASPDCIETNLERRRSSVESHVGQRRGSKMGEFTNYATSGVIPWLMLVPFQVRLECYALAHY
jgi:hypothetical protein